MTSHYVSRTGKPGPVVVPQYRSSKITAFVWGKNTILKFVGNTKYKSKKLTLQERFLKPLPCFRPKSVIFATLFQT